MIASLNYLFRRFVIQYSENRFRRQFSSAMMQPFSFWMVTLPAFPKPRVSSANRLKRQSLNPKPGANESCRPKIHELTVHRRFP